MGGGANEVTGLRGRAAYDRGGGGADLVRRFCSGRSALWRDVCCWLALSCSIPALSCWTSCPKLARSRAIDCSNCADESSGFVAGSGALWVTGAACGDGVLASLVWMAAAAGCDAGSDGSDGIEVVSTSCVVSLAIFFLATSP